MSNIVVQRENERPVVARRPEASFDPLGVMRALLSWDPFHEMVPSLTADERVSVFAAAFDVKETTDAYVFRADVPGVRENEIEVTITGNRLTVSGKREQESEARSDRYYNIERRYGAFSRSFTLPDGADGEHLRASLQDGVLEITVPKKPEVQSRKVEVEGSKATAAPTQPKG